LPIPLFAPVMSQVEDIMMFKGGDDVALNGCFDI
jgi:hypothetical protein